MLSDLASDGTIPSIKYASLSLDAEGEEVRWDATVYIKLDFIVKSIGDSPRPSQSPQSVPPQTKFNFGLRVPADFSGCQFGNSKVFPLLWRPHKSGTSRKVRIFGLPTEAKIDLARSLQYGKTSKQGLPVWRKSSRNRALPR